MQNSNDKATEPLPFNYEMISREGLSNYLKDNLDRSFKRRDKNFCPLAEYLRFIFQREDIWATGIGIQVEKGAPNSPYFPWPMWMHNFQMKIDWVSKPHLPDTYFVTGREALKVLEDIEDTPGHFHKVVQYAPAGIWHEVTEVVEGPTNPSTFMLDTGSEVSSEGQIPSE